jgi:methylglutaconyl-CoA hydratase
MMKHIKVELQNEVQWVRLNRPEKRNAFEPEMIAELTAIFKKASLKTARAIVLTGEGESFCSGGDLQWMKSMAKYTLKQNAQDSENLFDMYESIRNCPLPVIGKVHGHAFGGGVGLTAVCDIVAAESQTQFCFSEVKWGLVPAVISSFCLEKMSPNKAQEWMLTAKVFSASEAYGAGLIHFAGSQADVNEYVDKTLKLLRKAGPEALNETKKLLHFLRENPRSKYRKQSTSVIAKRRVSKEGQAGLTAFLEKKPTPWG